MNWREIQRENFTSWAKLCRFLELDAENVAKKSPFPLNLPKRLALKISKGSLDDPILRQFIPNIEESRKNPLYLADPVGDQIARKAPKYLKKYGGRVLLLTSSACAMHCRYCFRQHFSYSRDRGFQQELKLIQTDPSIREVILSGGDPLSLSNRILRELIEEIGAISHIQRLRFHTRFPIGIPERIDHDFLSILEKSRLQIWFVIHCNHPRELDDDIVAALKKIQRLGIPLLNQSVLLKGVNNSVEILQSLSEKLVDAGIQPYYLHQLDRVDGASHFEVTEVEGLKLIEALRKRLSGYAVPQYVREEVGEFAKKPINASEVEAH